MLCRALTRANFPAFSDNMWDRRTTETICPSGLDLRLLADHHQQKRTSIEARPRNLFRILFQMETSVLRVRACHAFLLFDLHACWIQLPSKP